MDNKKFYFLITIHFHQPIGNFDYVIERVCKRCYEPFLNTISDFTDIKFNLHFSGCLLEWFKKHRPDMLKKIAGLVARGQVELLGGGFYEPILPILPPEDRIGQIQMLSQFIKDEFGSSVSGAWLAERVWEPQLAETFSKAGIKYSIVDDTHLRYSGLAQSQLYGYYVTEENGNCLSIFPSDKRLRYAIPFHLPHETINYFRTVKEEYKKTCVLYGDDGEKFGEWPGTEKWVYEEKWLYNFLKALSDNSSWVSTARISDYLDKEPPSGRVYLPTASYQEMSEWSLPTDAAERLQDIIDGLKREGRYDSYVDFIRGGFWRNFLVKYPEANNMHKRMLLVSDRLRHMEALAIKKSMVMLSDAKRELFRSQCNCAYWHGVFGGLYLYHLRCAIYKHIISADTMMDAIEYKTKGWVNIYEKDFDCDGCKEIIVATRAGNFIIDPEAGGALREWDIKEKSLNIINTLSRKKEAYHRKISGLETAAKNEGQTTPATIHDITFTDENVKSKELVYDRHNRVSFIDHFILKDTDLPEVISSAYKETGDFANAGYKVVKLEKRKTPFIEMKRDGHVNQKPISLTKRFMFLPDKNKISVRYTITNRSSSTIASCFSPELNFSITQDDVSRPLLKTDSIILYDKIEHLNICINLSEKADKVLRFFVCTVSQSEKGIEENYQATCVMPLFDVKLNKNSQKVIEIEIEVRPL